MLWPEGLSHSAPVLPTYTGDFLPYEEGFFNYWTGFYSSRPCTGSAVCPRELCCTFLLSMPLHHTLPYHTIP